MTNDRKTELPAAMAAPSGQGGDAKVSHAKAVDAEECEVRRVFTESDDGSSLHMHQGHRFVDFESGTRQPGTLPTLNPGALGGIGQFADECADWGFDPRVEGKPCCDDQFDMTERMLDGIRMGMLACHSATYYAGWWHDKATGEVLTDPVNIPVHLMLMVSELAEAMEGDRKGLMDDHIPTLSNFEVELADAYIRLMNLAGATQCDLAGAVAAKMAYNAVRADHKTANRNAAGGKAY